MNLKNIPTYFLFAAILYIVILLASLAYFIFPAISFGLATELGFYVLAIPMLLPLFLLLGMLKSGGVAGILRILFVAFTLIAGMILILFILIPLVG